MKNTISLLKGALLGITIVATASLQAGFQEQIGDFIASKAPNPAVKASCSIYAASAATAKALNLAPGVKETMKNTCCKYADFRKSNPNVVEKALDNCAGVEVEENYKATDSDFCHVAALAGKGLNKVPAKVKTQLNKICCDYEDVMEVNPKAAEAIGCKVSQPAKATAVVSKKAEVTTPEPVEVE